MTTAARLGWPLLTSAVLWTATAGGLAISDEVAPPGGVAQIKLMPTVPTPISKGDYLLAFDTDFFVPVGIALYSPTGDVEGVAQVTPAGVRVRFTSPQGTFGMVPDYPILTIAVAIRPDAPPGTRMAVNLDLSSVGLDLYGMPYPQEVRQGSVTVGGSLSINNVVPGGGQLAPSQPFFVEGVGFQPGARLHIDGAEKLDTEVLSPTLIRASTPAALTLDGQRLRLRNPDGTRCEYFSYLRAMPAELSARSALSGVVALHSTRVYYDAILPGAGAGPFTALAFQNPGSRPASISVSLYSPSDALLAAAVVDLPAGMRIARELSEVLPAAAAPLGSYIRIRTETPVQFMGLFGTGLLPQPPVAVRFGP